MLHVPHDDLVPVKNKLHVVLVAERLKHVRYHVQEEEHLVNVVVESVRVKAVGHDVHIIETRNKPNEVYKQSPHFTRQVFVSYNNVHVTKPLEEPFFFLLFELSLFISLNLHAHAERRLHSLCILGKLIGTHTKQFVPLSLL